MAARLASGRHAVTAHTDALSSLRTNIRSSSVPVPSESPRLHLLARREEQLPTLIERFARSSGSVLATVYLDLDDWAACGRAVAAFRSAGVPVMIAAPRILTAAEAEQVDRLLAFEPDAALVRNLGMLQRLRNRAPHLPLIGDFSLNVANELAADLLLGLGLTRIAPALDLNLGQWSALRTAASSIPLEAVIHAHLPMLHMAHCVAAAALTDGNNCADCGRPCRRHEVRLRDRLGVEHLVTQDIARRTTVFNGNVQSAADLWADLDRIGVRDFRVELLGESPPSGRGSARCLRRFALGPGGAG